MCTHRWCMWTTHYWNFDSVYLVYMLNIFSANASREHENKWFTSRKYSVSFGSKSKRIIRIWHHVQTAVILHDVRISSEMIVGWGKSFQNISSKHSHINTSLWHNLQTEALCSINLHGVAQRLVMSGKENSLHGIVPIIKRLHRRELHTRRTYLLCLANKRPG